MKRFRIAVCLLLTLLLVLMTGCSGLTEDPQLRESTENMLEAIIADDYQAARDTIYDEVSETEFRSAYAQLSPILAGVSDYELTVYNINQKTINGVTTISVRYMLTAGDLQLLVDAARTEGYEGLTGFYLTEYVSVTTTGTLGNMQGTNVLQWIFLAVGLLEWAFVIFVFVDCCRRKIRKKWLWLLLIALGHLIAGLIATPEQFRITFNIGAFLISTSLIHYSTGGFMVRIMVPAGAIIYLLLRKKLLAKYIQVQQENELAEVPAAVITVPEESSEPDAEENVRKPADKTEE